MLSIMLLNRLPDGQNVLSRVVSMHMVLRLVDSNWSTVTMLLTAQLWMRQIPDSVSGAGMAAADSCAHMQAEDISHSRITDALMAPEGHD